MKLRKDFYNLSKDEKTNYLLEHYSCSELAVKLVELLENPAISFTKLHISQHDFDTHFSIIKPRVRKSTGNETIADSDENGQIK